MYYQTIYTQGDKGHIHVFKGGSSFVCFKKHRRTNYFVRFVVVAALVEVAISLFLINKAW